MRNWTNFFVHAALFLVIIVLYVLWNDPVLLFLAGANAGGAAVYMPRFWRKQ